MIIGCEKLSSTNNSDEESTPTANISTTVIPSKPTDSATQITQETQPVDSINRESQGMVLLK
jgi:hypothetical protein